jgi:hypothetical protein
MHRCNQFNDLPALQGAIDRWLRDGLWGAVPDSPAQSWFEHCQLTLKTAFGVFCESRLPLSPARPNAITGLSLEESVVEVRTIAATVGTWSVFVGLYLTCIYGKASPACRNATAALAGRLDTLTTQLRAAASLNGTNIDSRDKLCRAFAVWARLFREWTRAFARFEQAIHDCLKVERGLTLTPGDYSCLLDDDATDGDDLYEILQIAPVPWPPWPGVDES